jgi:endonuclease/exonuclease/phosphatase family metal-dependent hydrolase
LTEQEPIEPRPVRIVTYNIQYSRGKDGAFDLGRIAETLRSLDADIAGLQEVTRYLGATPDQDQVAELAALLPEYYWVYGSPADVDASVRHDDGSIVNRRAQFGNMLLSRWPVSSLRLELLPRVRTFEHASLQRGVLEAVIDHPSGPLRVYVVHLDHLQERLRVDEIAHLLDFAEAASRHGTAVTGPSRIVGASNAVPPEYLVIGDCNMLPGSPAYLRMTGEPDYYYGQIMSSDRLVDTWPLVGREITDGVTWWDETTDFTTGTRLDYVFVTPGLARSVRAAGIDDAATGSDHQPVWIDLDLS